MKSLQNFLVNKKVKKLFDINNWPFVKKLDSIALKNGYDVYYPNYNETNVFLERDKKFLSNIPEIWKLSILIGYDSCYNNYIDKDKFKYFPEPICKKIINFLQNFNIDYKYNSDKKEIQIILNDKNKNRINSLYEQFFYTWPGERPVAIEFWKKGEKYVTDNLLAVTNEIKNKFGDRSTYTIDEITT